jgi:hypothetical protein
MTYSIFDFVLSNLNLPHSITSEPVEKYSVAIRLKSWLKNETNGNLLNKTTDLNN